MARPPNNWAAACWRAPTCAVKAGEKNGRLRAEYCCGCQPALEQLRASWKWCCGGIGAFGDESPIGKSGEQRLNLSGSKQQGLSTAYNTVFRPSRLQGIYPNERVELS